MLAGALVAALALALSLTAGGATKRTSDDSLVGAGSTFAAPLFTAWYQVFNPKAGANVSYNSIGSGAGIAQITARTVDFGASDAPLTPSQASACNGCVQIPVLLGTTAILYNVPGATKQINLTGPIIANIYLGNITQWDDRGDQGDQPRREPAEPEDHAGLPLGRLGHELQLHRLPVEGEPGVRSARSASRRSRRSRSASAGEAAPASPGWSRARRARSATPTSRTR